GMSPLLCERVPSLSLEACHWYLFALTLSGDAPLLYGNAPFLYGNAPLLYGKTDQSCAICAKSCQIVPFGNFQEIYLYHPPKIENPKLARIWGFRFFGKRVYSLC